MEHKLLLEIAADPDSVSPASHAQRIRNFPCVICLLCVSSSQHECNRLVDDMVKERRFNMGIDLHDLEEAAVLLDRNTSFRMVRISHPDAGKTAEPAINPIQLKSQLKQIALPVHTHHNTYSVFPDNDGPDNENKDNLRGRLPLLPFVDESELYQQFNLIESWDSETNQVLIENMPDVLRTVGVDETGLTSMHVFIADDSPSATIQNGHGLETSMTALPTLYWLYRRDLMPPKSGRSQAG